MQDVHVMLFDIPAKKGYKATFEFSANVSKLYVGRPIVFHINFFQTHNLSKKTGFLQGIKNTLFKEYKENIYANSNTQFDLSVAE